MTKVRNLPEEEVNLWGDMEDCAEENLDEYCFDFDSISHNSSSGEEGIRVDEIESDESDEVSVDSIL